MGHTGANALTARSALVWPLLQALAAVQRTCHLRDFARGRRSAGHELSRGKAMVNTAILFIQGMGRRGSAAPLSQGHARSARWTAGPARAMYSLLCCPALKSVVRSDAHAHLLCQGLLVQALGQRQGGIAVLHLRNVPDPSPVSHAASPRRGVVDCGLAEAVSSAPSSASCFRESLFS